jgi:GGDEF domain-containing protein
LGKLIEEHCYRANSNPIYLKATFGPVTNHPKLNQSAHEFLEKALIALEEAKRAGGNGIA